MQLLSCLTRISIFLRKTATSIFLVLFLLGGSTQLSAGTLDNGIDPANLGKGDWIWQMYLSLPSLGLAANDVQGLVNYEKAAGMQWIAVKAGDGGTVWSQFDTNLIASAHSAGLKIFAWAPVYGASGVSNEIALALNAISLGADGFIIDAEADYESPGQSANAAIYCQGIRAKYPKRFLAHSPYPIISGHTNFPYVTFGTYCDAVMPQVYWADFGGSNYAPAMVDRVNDEWRNWQNSLTGNATNAIKPLAPIGQGYNSVNGPVDGSQILAFVQELKHDPYCPTAGGYKGFSFWSCQTHSDAPNKWPAITAARLADPVPNAARFQSITTQPDHTLQFLSSGDVGATYTILTSTNLRDWSAMATVTATNGVISFTSDPSTNGPQNYFRIRSGP